VEAWTDERLDDLVATLRPLPGEIGAVRADLAAEMGAVRAELAAVRVELAKLDEKVSGLIEDNRAIRGDLLALHRLIAQIGFGLSGALVGVLIALIVAVV
jgi:hypothetical protein